VTIHQSLDQLVSNATEFYALHQRYITDEWGTFQLTGETYRQKGEKDWAAAQAALLELKVQADAPIPLLQRSSLTIVLNAMQGMQIRLTQRFAETPDDPAIQEDQAKSLQLWQALNQIDRELYQQLG
jgi:hypothetical protein